MKLRNFVTNIMITKNFRETRYQYNDHEGWGGNLVTNIMITNFFREIRYQDNDHEGFPRNVVIISWACKNFMNSDQFVIRAAQTPCGGRFVAYKAYCNYITWTHVYLDLKLIHKNICKPLASSIKPSLRTYSTMPDSSWTLHNIYTYLRLYIWSIWYFDLKSLNKNVRNARALNQQVSPWTLYNMKLVLTTIWRLHFIWKEI